MTNLDKLTYERTMRRGKRALVIGAAASLAIAAGSILGYASIGDNARLNTYDTNPASCYQATEKAEMISPSNDPRYGCQRP